MKGWLTLCLSLGVASIAVGQTLTPEHQFQQGTKLYKADNYAEGLVMFQSALTNLVEGSTLDAALIHYNIGVGHYRLSQPELAGIAFQSALRSTDLALQRKAYFNHGNAQYQIARQALDSGDIVTAFRGFQAAQTNFMQALRIVSDDRDAKVNFELSLLAQFQIIQMVEMAMSRLQQGEQLVDQYKFVDAARWFSDQLPLAQKALELEPEKKKLFETMTERSSAVADIIAGPPTGESP